jgi:hypothetical protein
MPDGPIDRREYVSALTTSRRRPTRSRTPTNTPLCSSPGTTTRRCRSANEEPWATWKRRVLWRATGSLDAPALRGAEGNVAAGEDTAVRFEHPGIGGVALDGEQAPAVDSGAT